MGKHINRQETYIEKQIKLLEQEVADLDAKLVEEMPFERHIEMIRYRRTLLKDLDNFKDANKYQSDEAKNEE